MRKIVITITQQKLYLMEGEKVLKVYPVSTSSLGASCRKNSGGTPTGRHRIYRKIGEGLPEGAVFKGRKFTGEIVQPGEVREDLITSRILWLEGDEEGVNKGGEVDTKERYIYIHGTPHENLIGRPVSNGCIRMRNRDIMELFDNVEEGCVVEIIP